MSDLVAKDESSLNISSLEPQEKEKALGIANGINIDDSQGIIQYGVSAQSKIAGFADTILSQVRNKDSGYVGEVLGDLVRKVKDLRIGELKSGGALGNLPIIGGLVNSFRKFISKYEKISVQIERVVQDLDRAKMDLLKDIALLDSLYQKNGEYLKELDIYIAAGQFKLQELKEQVLPQLQQKAQESDDPADAQKLQDFNQAFTRFEKKLHDLKLSRMVSIQTSPQIRLIQSNDQTLVEKIQSSIMTTIPLWKNQIVIAISLFRQKKALKLQREVSNTTNDLLSRNAEMLKQGSIDVAKESERGIVDMETLKKVNGDLIETIEETLRIQAEGKAKRVEAEKELAQLEGDLKTRLKTVQ